MLNIDLNKIMEAEATTSDSTITSSIISKSNIITENGVNWKLLGENIVSWASTTGVKMLIGLILLLILFKVTNFLGKRIRNGMAKRGVDKTITSVFYQTYTIGFKIIWILLFLGIVGIQAASIGSVIASVGVAIGLAIQGTLSNLAGGIMIVVTRPFKVGDFITAQGQSGTVEDIRFFYTHLVTTDNKAIMIPNGVLSAGVIVNVNTKPERRVDEVFSIAYDADYTKAVKLITKVINANELVLKDHNIFVRMSAHSDSSIDITTRVWVKTEDYWAVHFYLLEEVKKAFDKNGIEIPYNKLDVNVLKKVSK